MLRDCTFVPQHCRSRPEQPLGARHRCVAWRCSRGVLARPDSSSLLAKRLGRLAQDLGVRGAAGRGPAGALAEGAEGAVRDIAGAAAAGRQGFEVQQHLHYPAIAVLSYRERPEVAREAVENIAAAFEDDPSTAYFCRPGQRVQFYRSVLGRLLDWYPVDKQLVCTLPSPNAAAFVYVYPRSRELSGWSKLLRGGLAPLGCVRLGRLGAGLEASDFFEGLREDFLRAHGPFLYVSVMAVRPGAQGRGLGSALLAFLVDRADAAGLHCYIEATSPRNRALYERFGFKLVQAWRADLEMPYTYVLSRPPRPLDPEEKERALEAAAGTAEADTAASVTVPDAATVAAAAAPAGSPSLWWPQGGQLGRRRFLQRRQQQLRRQIELRHSPRTPSGDDAGPQREVPYTDLDEYSWWPLRAGEPLLAAEAAAGDDDGNFASTDHHPGPYGKVTSSTSSDAATSAAAASAVAAAAVTSNGATSAAGWFGSWVSKAFSRSSHEDVASVGEVDVSREVSSGSSSGAKDWNWEGGWGDSGGGGGGGGAANDGGGDE